MSSDFEMTGGQETGRRYTGAEMAELISRAIESGEIVIPEDSAPKLTIEEAADRIKDQ